MSSQKEIALRTGLTQATVSMALRNHPSVSAATRERVLRVAREMEYKPNPLVSSLMTHIRSGRHLRDQGTLAIIVATSKVGALKEAWMTSEVYNGQYRGVCQRAEQLGYRVECFFWEEYGSSSRLDRVLYSRGISGVLLAPPQNLPKSPIQLRWENYAYAAIAYSWPDLLVHRSATHHRHNMDIAYRELQKRGYKRIGLCLPPDAVEGVDANWLTGYLYWQWKSPAKYRIPLFIGDLGQKGYKAFSRWYQHHRPEVILSLGGHEKRWLDDMGLSIPGDVGLACVNRSRVSSVSGVEENHEAVGGAAADLLIHQIQSNERGFIPFPKLVLIEGTWVERATLRPRPVES